MAINPSVPDLVKFLKSALSPAQIKECVELLKGESNTTLDPESSPKKQTPAPKLNGLNEILDEMEAAYSVAKFPPLSVEESRRVRDFSPGFIERCNANQGRHLVKVLRDRLLQ